MYLDWEKQYGKGREKERTVYHVNLNNCMTKNTLVQYKLNDLGIVPSKHLPFQSAKNIKTRKILPS